MVDAHAVDDAVAHELDHLRVRRPEDLPVLLLDAAELADVEEAAVEAGAQVDVEEHLAQREVAPERVLVDRRHVVRDDVEDHAEAGGGERAELVLAAERLGDVARVDDVVAVLRALARLQRRREVEVRDAELAQVRHELARLREAEVRRQLQAVGRAKVTLGTAQHRERPALDDDARAPANEPLGLAARRSRARSPSACRTAAPAGGTRSPRSAR